MTAKIRCSKCGNLLYGGRNLGYTIEIDYDIDVDELGRAEIVNERKRIVCLKCGRKVEEEKIKKETWDLLWKAHVEGGINGGSVEKLKVSRRTSGNKKRKRKRSNSNGRNNRR